MGFNLCCQEKGVVPNFAYLLLTMTLSGLRNHPKTQLNDALIATYGLLELLDLVEFVKNSSEEFSPQLEPCTTNP